MLGTLPTKKVQRLQEKVKYHRLEKERTKSRFREVSRSRDNWKEKAKKRLERCRELEHRIKKLESQLVSHSVPSSRAARHHYPVWLVWLCLLLRNQGVCSLRVCAELIAQVSLVLGLGLGRPSPSSVSNWEYKLGLYHLLAPPTDADLSEQPWCLFIDESLAIGRQKVLLLLGLDLDQNQFGRAPDFEQVRLLHLGVAPSWKASDIAPIIQRLQNQGYQFLYCPSDQGNNLVKSLKTAQIPRVSDCTHACSKLIEKQYKDHATFLAFTQACTLMRKRLIISDYAAIMPPHQRAKARFLNLREVAKWGHQSLELLHKLSTAPEFFPDQSPQQIERMKQELQWLKPMEQLIEELFVVSQNMDQIFKILKHQGLCEQTAEQVKILLRGEAIPNFWKEGVEKYIDQILAQFPDTKEPIVCCCDIIESYFGKFKLAASQNPGQGITGACLRMASFSHKTDIQTTKDALESILVNQIHQWKKEELPPNLIQLKKQINKSVTNFPTQNTS